MSRVKMALAYINHYIKGYNRHGIHSPFVYAFLEDLLYVDKNKTDFASIEDLRKELLHNSEVIEITDLGAGSQFSKGNTRSIQEIAKNAAKPAKYGRLFNRMISYFDIKSVIELGTSLGISGLYFSHHHPETTVHTIEGCPNTFKAAKNNFEKMGATNIQQYLGNFDDVLPEVLKKVSPVELVFIDGNHQEKATLNYFEMLLPHLSEKSILIFDDIHWSEGMTKAWDKIKGHPQTKVTLDLFFIGIVFFDSRLTKQDFLIRF